MNLARITTWVCAVVTDAYASAKAVALPEGEVRAREMHTLASSLWAGLQLVLFYW